MTTNCGCCEGVESITPEPISNRPGLPALTYRIGTHGSFLESMQARLAQVEVEVPQPDGTFTKSRPLTGLTTRDPADPALALLDGWATVADVLTFYQERIANEGYLRTATERRSILELARLVGYTLRPGVAATVYLAYSIDPNQVESAEIPLYTSAQSIPGPGEMPQTFETVEKLQAYAKWNNLQPRLTRPQTLDSIRQNRAVYFQGVTTNLKPGDALLLGVSGQRILARVLQVDIDGQKLRTIVQVGPWYEHTAAAAVVAQREALVQSYRNAVRQAVDRQLATLAASHAATANLARGILSRLRDSSASADSATLNKQVDQALKELEAARNELPATATLLRPQLDETIKELDRVRTETGEALASFSAREFGQLLLEMEEDYGYEPPPPDAGDDLLGVVRGLSLPPSVPPRNALYLRRDLGTAFRARSDLGLQVLGAVKPDLKTLIPVALSNVQATRAAPVQAYALRVKAGIYGNTAPARSITNSQGQVIATVDWPINGSYNLRVRIVNLEGDAATVSVQSQSPKGDVETVTLSVQGSGQENDGSSPSGNLTVKVSLDLAGHTSTLKVTVTLAGLEQTLVWTLDTSAESLTLSGAANDGSSFGPLTVSRDEKQVFTFGRRISQLYIDTGFTGKSDNPMFSTEVPRPPDPRTLISLDGPYDQITPGGYAVILRDGGRQPLVTQVEQVNTIAHNDYNMPSKVTDLTLSLPWLRDDDLYLGDVSDTVVLAGSECLDLAEEPIPDPICGADQWIELDGLYSGLQAGRWLIVAGDRADVKDRDGNPVPGLAAAELVMLADVQHDIYRGQTEPAQPGPTPVVPVKTITRAGEFIAAPLRPYGVTPEEPDSKVLPGDTNHTFIRLSTALSFCYTRDTVTIYGNVVKATHGESRNETLGGGDATQPFQSFTLKQTPLTFVSAPTAAGAASTLRLYVNNLEWKETESFVDCAPTDHKFVTKTGDDDKVTLTSGDGKTAARLATGQENVRAWYRQGIGKAGNVRAKQISLLVARPLGVMDVINPLPAMGGADRESGDQARENVPLGILALDRLVSVQDYADFSRTFAGIGKAVSTPLPYGGREMVQITIAGADDIPIDPTSDLYQNLLLALRTLGDPDVPVRVDLRELLMLVMQAEVSIKPDRIWDVVVTDIREALYTTFSFAKQGLGEDVWLSRVISTIQAVDGVQYVNVQVLGGIPEKTTDVDGTRRLLTPNEISQQVQQLVAKQLAEGPDQSVTVGLADIVNGTLQPAQLAFLSRNVPGTLILNQVNQ